MKVKVEFIQMIWDNYQGASGKPITRSVLMELPDDTHLSDIESRVIEILTNTGIKRTYNESERVYFNEGILSIIILPILK